MLLKNFFAKINFEKIFRVRNTEIFENFFVKEQNSDEIDVGVLLLYEKVFKNLWVSDSEKFFKIYFCEKVF